MWPAEDIPSLYKPCSYQ